MTGFQPVAGSGGDDLEQALERTRRVTEAVAVTYLGQVGFLFQHRGVTVAVDPYLSFAVDELPDEPPGFWRRNYPPPIAPDRLHGVGLVLCTHDHLDHTDPETLLGIAAGSPEAVFAAPRRSAALMVKAGLPADRVRTLEAGLPFCFGEVVVHPIPAAHEDYERDAGGHYRHLGYVLRWAGRTFFHAGDTTPQEQLSADLAPFQIDVGFLPINGRDEERRRKGVVGNMNCREAAGFATRHAFGLVVPTHFDLYENNGAELPDFVREIEALDHRLRFKAFRPGEQMLYPALDS